MYDVVDGSNTLPAWHKSNIWDAPTTTGVYSTRAKPGFSAHYAVSIIHIHTDVGLILPKLGMCPWIIHCSLN